MTTITINKPQFTTIPHQLFSANLDVYQFRVMAQYWHEDNGTQLTVRELADRTGISVGKINNVRQELADMGLISIEKQGNSIIVTLLLCSPHEQPCSPHEQADEKVVHHMNNQSHTCGRVRDYGIIYNNHSNNGDNRAMVNNTEGIDFGLNKNPKSVQLSGDNFAVPQLAFSDVVGSARQDDWDAVAKEVKVSRKPTEKQVVTQTLSEFFLEITKLPAPPQNFAMLQRRWWSPLWYIYTELANKSLERAKRLIRAAVDQLRDSNLTFDSPDSLTKTVRHLYSTNEFGPKQMVVIA